MRPNHYIGLICGVIVLFDQVTKWIVIKTMPFGSERPVIDGFFKFVHWGNDGAAWSMFKGNNHFLAIVSCIALLALFIFRKHFEFQSKAGYWALGLMYGGIVGNLIDRLSPRAHVTDFLYFYIYQQGGAEREIGFPAFNIADVAICTAVGLLFLLSWQQDVTKSPGETLPADLTAETPADPALPAEIPPAPPAPEAGRAS